MSVAIGTLNSPADDVHKITAVFSVGSLKKSLAATVTSAVPHFHSARAKMKYDNLESIDHATSFTGSLGPDTFEFTFSNGVQIKGTLKTPIDLAATDLQGSGTWATSMSMPIP
ncbi:hypothetical protein F5144DRAFT_176508 [Chaetomium tenue]|uniref:Uncharacterized protein n=1 Tax=Chaetomium tenue TaxID=1854479 RepID=A0ACB7PDG8_9PEZI|nr:hypothetical protein F5144DRAFT_176508 [Chaetomium globosum]